MIDKINSKATFDFNNFCKTFKIDLKYQSDDFMEFDLIGIDAAIANALRRIMIADVPTMAIEHVFVVNNSSIIQDEVLAHRLGLVPVFADPTKFDYPTKGNSNQNNTIVFRISVNCDPDHITNKNKKVFSNALKWLPLGSEMPLETNCQFSEEQKSNTIIGTAQDNILLAILAPGQEIALEAHCIKGIGRDHAKWSPVSTQWYRFLSEAILLKEINGKLAKELSNELPGLITLVSKGKHNHAVIKKAREHELLMEKCRRLCTEGLWATYLQIRNKKNHFMFTIETSGSLKARDVFYQAIDILILKLDSLLKKVL